MNANTVIEATPRPAEPDSPPVGFKRILVAVDGSEQSDFAVEAAARLARQLGADVVLCTVFSVDSGCNSEGGFLEPDVRDDRLADAHAMLDKIKAQLPHPGRVETVVCEGDPPTEIAACAKLYGADLIVMGTHGRGRIGHVIMGSVTSAVARKASCPVMTVAHELPGKSSPSKSGPAKTRGTERD